MSFKRGMTRVKTGVKGNFEANIAPKTLKKRPPTPVPKEIELATSTHTQVPHKSHITSTQDLVNFFLQTFKGSYVKETTLFTRN